MERVEDGSEPQPIEIELTANEPADHRRADKGHDAAAGSSTAPEHGGWSTSRVAAALSTERGRLVVSGCVIAVVALLLGWVIGRSGTAEPTLSFESVPSTAPSTTAPLTGERLPAVDDAAVDDTVAARTTAPRRTTTTVPERSVDEIEIHPRAAAPGSVLIGTNRDGDVIEVDLATGERSTRRLSRLRSEQTSLIVGDDWIVIPQIETGRFDLIVGDGEPEEVDLGDPWTLFWVAGTDRFWRGIEFGPRGPNLFEEVTVQGEPTGERLEVDGVGWISGADPAGGLLVVQSGRTYTIGSDGARLVADGEILAMDSSIAVSRTCDEFLVCSLVVTDRATGVVTQVPAHESTGPINLIEPQFFWGGQRTNTVSPDSNWCLAVAHGTSETSELSVGLLHLGTGRFHEIATDLYLPSGVAWLADSSVAYFANHAGAPNFFDVETGEIGVVSDDLTRWTDVAIRRVVDG